MLHKCYEMVLCYLMFVLTISSFWVGMGNIGLLRTGSRALKRRHISTPEQGEPLRHILWGIVFVLVVIVTCSFCMLEESVGECIGKVSLFLLLFSSSLTDSSHLCFSSCRKFEF